MGCPVGWDRRGYRRASRVGCLMIYIYIYVYKYRIPRGATPLDIPRDILWHNPCEASLDFPYSTTGIWGNPQGIAHRLSHIAWSASWNRCYLVDILATIGTLLNEYIKQVRLSLRCKTVAENTKDMRNLCALKAYVPGNKLQHFPKIANTLAPPHHR